jgi:hypothetical protein
MSGHNDAQDAALIDRAPTLRAYLQRVGTVQKSFRRHVIEVKRGSYKSTLGSVSIDADGILSCRGDVEPPTAVEATRITAEVLAANWPTSMPAGPRIIDERLNQIGREHLFIHRSASGDNILLIQQRLNREDGSKDYYTWSFWSDGVWRMMEPDELLPLYGLDRLKNSSTIFLHEGASAARYVQWMVNRETKEARDAFDACPWGPSLTGAAHLGWIGGAPNPDRTDWSPLRALPKDVRIVVVADNDAVGVSAISAISSKLRRRMSAVIFDDSFKPGFDLADQWPRHPDWWNDKRYLGPTLDDLSRPATWATKVLKADKKKGPPRIVLRDEFRDEWLLSMEPHLAAHRTLTNKLYSPEVLNRYIAPFSDAEDVARLLSKEVSVHADGIAYRPQKKSKLSRLVIVDGERLINTFRPSVVVPLVGDWQPFLDFMKYLFPDPEDREHVLRWCATLIARPDVRMRYALLLISERQGVGKTSLIDAVLAPLVGRWNVSTPSESQIADSGFNSWIAHKRLAHISEIYSGQSRKSYDRLKVVIADDSIDVNRKYMEPYTIENWLHVVACSNSIRALHVDDGDRRWLVPRVTEELKPREWWDSFHGWLRGGGLPLVAAWAEAYVEEHGAVRTGDRAPDTTAKDEVIAETRSEGQRLAVDLAGMAKEFAADKGDGKVVLLVDEVRAWIASKRGMSIDNGKLESGLTLRRALIGAGLLEPDRKPGASDRRVKVGQRWRSVVATFDIPADAKWEDDLKAYHKKPDRLEEM